MKYQQLDIHSEECTEVLTKVASGFLRSQNDCSWNIIEVFKAQPTDRAFSAFKRKASVLHVQRNSDVGQTILLGFALADQAFPAEAFIGTEENGVHLCVYLDTLLRYVFEVQNKSTAVVEVYWYALGREKAVRPTPGAVWPPRPSYGYNCHRLDTTASHTGGDALGELRSSMVYIYDFPPQPHSPLTLIAVKLVLIREEAVPSPVDPAAENMFTGYEEFLLSDQVAPFPTPQGWGGQPPQTMGFANQRLPNQQIPQNSITQNTMMANNHSMMRGSLGQGHMTQTLNPASLPISQTLQNYNMQPGVASFQQPQHGGLTDMQHRIASNQQQMSQSAASRQRALQQQPSIAPTGYQQQGYQNPLGQSQMQNGRNFSGGLSQPLSSPQLGQQTVQQQHMRSHSNNMLPMQSIVNQQNQMQQMQHVRTVIETQSLVTQPFNSNLNSNHQVVHQMNSASSLYPNIMDMRGGESATQLNRSSPSTNQDQTRRRGRPRIEPQSFQNHAGEQFIPDMNQNLSLMASMVQRQPQQQAHHRQHPQNMPQIQHMPQTHQTPLPQCSPQLQHTSRQQQIPLPQYSPHQQQISPSQQAPHPQNIHQPQHSTQTKLPQQHSDSYRARAHALNTNTSDFKAHPTMSHFRQFNVPRPNVTEMVPQPQVSPAQSVSISQRRSDNLLHQPDTMVQSSQNVPPVDEREPIVITPVVIQPINEDDSPINENLLTPVEPTPPVVQEAGSQEPPKVIVKTEPKSLHDWNKVSDAVIDLTVDSPPSQEAAVEVKPKPEVQPDENSKVPLNHTEQIREWIRLGFVNVHDFTKDNPDDDLATPAQPSSAPQLPEASPSVVQASESSSSVVWPPQASPSLVQPPQASISVVQPPQASPSVVQPSEASTSVVRPPQASTSVVHPPQASPSVVQPPQASIPVVQLSEASTSVVQPPQASTSVVQPSEASTSVLQPPEASTCVAQPSEANISVVQPPQSSRSVVRPPQASSSAVQPPQASISVVQPSEASTSVVWPPQASTSVAQPSEASTSVVRPPQASTSVAQPSEASTSVVRPPQASTSVAQPSEASTSVVRPPQTSTSVAQPSEANISVVQPPQSSRSVVWPPRASTTLVQTQDDQSDIQSGQDNPDGPASTRTRLEHCQERLSSILGDMSEQNSVPAYTPQGSSELDSITEATAAGERCHQETPFISSLLRYSPQEQLTDQQQQRQQDVIGTIQTVDVQGGVSTSDDEKLEPVIAPETEVSPVSEKECPVHENDGEDPAAPAETVIFPTEDAKRETVSPTVSPTSTVVQHDVSIVSSSCMQNKPNKPNSVPGRRMPTVFRRTLPNLNTAMSSPSKTQSALNCARRLVKSSVTHGGARKKRMSAKDQKRMDRLARQREESLKHIGSPKKRSEKPMKKRGSVAQRKTKQMESLEKIPLGRCSSTAMLTSRRTSTTSSIMQNLDDVNMSYEPNEDDLNDFPHETSEFLNDDFISRVSPATVLPALDDDHITSTTQPVTFKCNVEEVLIGEENRDLVAKLQQITPEKMRKIHAIIAESTDEGPVEWDKEKRHSFETVSTEVQMEDESIPGSSEAEGVPLDGACRSDEGQVKAVETQPETTSVDEVPSSTSQSPEKENNCPGTLSHSIFKGLFYLSDSEDGDCEQLAAEPSSSQGNDCASKEQTVEPTSPSVGAETLDNGPQPVESTCIETVKSTSPLKEVETLTTASNTTQCYPAPTTELEESTTPDCKDDRKDSTDSSGVAGDHHQRDRKLSGEKKEKRRRSHSPVDDTKRKIKEEMKRERKEKKNQKSKDRNSNESRRSRHGSDDKNSSYSKSQENSKERLPNESHVAKESTRSRHHSNKEKKTSNSPANSPNKEQQDFRMPAHGEKGSHRLTVAEVVQNVRSRHPSAPNSSQQVRSLSRNSSVEKVDQFACSPQHQMPSPVRRTSSEKVDQPGRSPQAATGKNSSRHSVTLHSHRVDQSVCSPQHQLSTHSRRTSFEKVDQAGRSPHSSRHNVTPHASTERLEPHTNSNQPHTSPPSRRSSTEMVDQIRRNHRSPTSTKDAHRQQPPQPRQTSASQCPSDLEMWRKNSKLLSERLKKCHTWLEAHTQESDERDFHKRKRISILVDKAMIDEKKDGFTGRIKGFIHQAVPKKLLYGTDIRHTVSSKGFPLLLLKEITYKDYRAYQKRLLEIETLTKEAENSGWEHQEKLAEKIKQYEIILQRLCGWTPKKSSVFNESRQKYMSMKENLEKWGKQVPQEQRVNKERLEWLNSKLKEIDRHEHLFKECLTKSEPTKPQEGETKSAVVDANMVVHDMDVAERNPNTPPKINLPRPGEQTSASSSMPSVHSSVVGPTLHISFSPVTPPLTMVNPQWHCTVPPPLIPTGPPLPLMSLPQAALPTAVLQTAVQHPVATVPPPPPPPLPPSPQRVVGTPPLPPPLPSRPLKELKTAPPPLPTSSEDEPNVLSPVALSSASQSEIQISSSSRQTPLNSKAPLLSSIQKEPETPLPAPLNSTSPRETNASLPSTLQTKLKTPSPAPLSSALMSEPKTPLTSGPQIDLKTPSPTSLPLTSPSELKASLLSTLEKEQEMPSPDHLLSTIQDELNTSLPLPPQTSTPQHELKRSQLTGLLSTPLQKSSPSPLLSLPAALRNEDEMQSDLCHTETVMTSVMNENMETGQLQDQSTPSIADVNANLLTESEPIVEISPWVSHTAEVCITSDVSLGLNAASFASSKLCDSSLGLSVASLSSPKLSGSSLGLSVANLSSPKRCDSSLGLSEASLSTSKVSSPAEIPSHQKDSDSLLSIEACKSSAFIRASPIQCTDDATLQSQARLPSPSLSSLLARQIPASEKIGSVSLNEPAVSTLKPTPLPLTIAQDSGMDQALPDSPLSPEEVMVWSGPPDLEQPKQLPSPQSLLKTEVFEATSIETLQKILANCSAKVGKAEPDVLQSPVTAEPSTVIRCPETESKSRDVSDPVIQESQTKKPEDTSPPYDPLDPTAASDDEATLENDDHNKDNPPARKVERLQKGLHSAEPTFKPEGAIDSANQQRASCPSHIPSELAVSVTKSGLGRVEMIPGLSPPPSPKDIIKKESDRVVVQPKASLWSSSLPSRSSADIFDHTEVIPGLSPPHMPHHEDYALDEPESDDTKSLKPGDSGTEGRTSKASDIDRRLHAGDEIGSSMRGVKRKSGEFGRDSRSPPPKRLRSPPLSYGGCRSRTPSPLPWNYRSRQRPQSRSRSPVRRRSRSKSRPRRCRRSRSRSMPRTRSPTPTPLANNEPLWLQLKKDIAKPKSHGDTDMRNVQNTSSLSTNFVQRHYQRQSSYSRQSVDSRDIAYERCQYREPQPRRQAPVHRDRDWGRREHGYIAQRERDLTYSAAWRRQSTYD